ncbi:MAG TPA: carboxypeptidase-like regulatory domain-containing protein, partial [Vicinamibacterales bacterium]|nr:carboxypeptidase-like regulatory domain-containing protein [Vicinamibacterales bacterium]
RRTELSGRITGDRGLPQTDATVIVFADDASRWGFGTRYIRTARPDQDGRYTLRGMPPHDYLVVAVTDIEPGQWQDPEFLESIKPQAVRVALGEGESRAQDLKLARQ